MPTVLYAEQWRTTVAVVGERLLCGDECNILGILMNLLVALLRIDRSAVLAFDKFLWVCFTCLLTQKIVTARDMQHFLRLTYNDICSGVICCPEEMTHTCSLVWPWAAAVS